MSNNSEVMLTMAEAAYSIRVVAAQTGIAVDTLRVWERRYGFPKPARRAGGGRLYGPADVERLRLIARARQAGYRPADVIGLPDREIVDLIDGPSVQPLESSAAPAADVEAMLVALARDEVVRVRGMLRALALTLGPEAFVTKVAHPFAVRMGEAWASGMIDIRHEHLGTALLSAQLRLLLSAFEGTEEGPVVVLATLPGEAHALALDLVAVYLATHRATPRLLGPDTPPRQIAGAARAMRADVVGVSISGAHPDAPSRTYLRELRRALSGTSIDVWVGGAGAERVTPASARRTTSWAEILDALRATPARRAVSTKSRHRRE